MSDTPTRGRGIPSGWLVAIAAGLVLGYVLGAEYIYQHTAMPEQIGRTWGGETVISDPGGGSKSRAILIIGAIGLAGIAVRRLHGGRRFGLKMVGVAAAAVVCWPIGAALGQQGHDPYAGTLEIAFTEPALGAMQGEAVCAEMGIHPGIAWVTAETIGSVGATALGARIQLATEDFALRVDAAEAYSGPVALGKARFAIKGRVPFSAELVDGATGLSFAAARMITGTVSWDCSNPPPP